MPTAAGQGAIPSAPMPAAAAGQGAQQDYTAEQAANDIRDDTPLPRIGQLVARVRPPPSWYTSEAGFQLNLITQPFNYVRPAVRQWLRDDRISPLRNPPVLQVNLRGGRRRKTRAKRKHFRKRTSRRH